MATFTEYVTKQGDRLDLIAWAAYGDPWRWDEVLQNNPWLPIQASYPDGLKLIIPVDDLTQDLATDTTENLPPWK